MGHPCRMPRVKRSIPPTTSSGVISRDEQRLANVRSTPPKWRNQMINILFVGQKPETVDFSDPSLPPGFNAEKINAGIALGIKKIEERGWKGDTCMITPDAAGRTMLEKALTGANYDCVVIGGGMRLPPKGLVLFEMVVNIIHKSAPNATIAFNTRRHRRRRRPPGQGGLTARYAKEPALSLLPNDVRLPRPPSRKRYSCSVVANSSARRRSAPLCSRHCTQQTPREGQSMRTPPSGYPLLSPFPCRPMSSSVRSRSQS
jgi:hypothetical protein